MKVVDATDETTDDDDNEEDGTEEGDETGISAVASDITSSVDDAYYTLQGVRVAKPTVKGMYIYNGKKITVK